MFKKSAAAQAGTAGSVPAHGGSGVHAVGAAPEPHGLHRAAAGPARGGPRAAAARDVLPLRPLPAAPLRTGTAPGRSCISSAPVTLFDVFA